ncbi:hypothetical protein [Rhodococcus jostii]|uniref:hypothetical protein n=1 Tax=Rhodococcus jostii TaxID=132919 RepID=UPI003633DD86
MSGASLNPARSEDRPEKETWPTRRATRLTVFSWIITVTTRRTRRIRSIFFE